MGYVYFAQAEELTPAVAFLRGGKPGVCVALGAPFGTGPIKIGFTESPGSRMTALAEITRQRISLKALIRGSLATERGLHLRFGALRLGGDSRISYEWFRPDAPLIEFVALLSSEGYEGVREWQAPPTRVVRRGPGTRASRAVGSWLASGTDEDPRTQVLLAQQISELLHRRVSQSTVSSIARGDRSPRADLMGALRHLLGIEAEWWLPDPHDPKAPVVERLLARTGSDSS